MFHRKYKDKSFSGVSLQHEFPSETSLPAKGDSLRDDFSCETRFANFQRPHPPLDKWEGFPAMKGIVRVLILC